MLTNARGVELPWSGKGTPRLFSLPSGNQLWTPSWGHYWRQVKAAAGRPAMDFYELRHFCATRLIEAGLDYPDVAEQLGHADDQLVRKVYGHPSKRQRRDRVREALDRGAVAA